MLVLGRNKRISEDFIVIEPIGIIENNAIEIIEHHMRKIHFPNRGQIHTPKHLQKLTKGNYAIYELGISGFYHKDDYKSHYYEVRKLYRNKNLYEVIKVDYSFEKDKDIIVNKIRNGFTRENELLSKIIIETSDKYLLGPLNIEYNNSDNKCVITNNFEFEKYLLKVYDNTSDQLSMATILDRENNETRYFSIDSPNELNYIAELDIATEDYIIKESINLLRGQQEYKEITRRVYSDINNWLSSITFSEEININRLKITLKALDEVLPNKSYDNLSNQLLELPLVQEMVNNAIEKRYEKDYSKFLKKHEKLLSQITELEDKKEKLIDENLKYVEKLEESKVVFTKFTKFMNQKKDEIEQEILNQYFDSLLHNKLSSTKGQTIHNITEEHCDNFSYIHDLKTLRALFRNNLSVYSERDVQDKVLHYCLLTTKFKTPMFIVGHASHTLATIIKDTFAARFSRKVYFEDTKFSLYETLNNYEESIDDLNFTIIPNVHNSVTSLNLIPFLQERDQSNNHLIFTFDSYEESKYILEQLNNYPILNIEDKSFFPSPFEEVGFIEKGQLQLNLLNDFKEIYEFEESLDNIIDALDNIDAEVEVERKLKTKYRNIVYANQLVGDARTVLEYFPLIAHELKEKINNYAADY